MSDQRAIGRFGRSLATSAVAVSVLLPVSARADVLLETYEGERPADASKILAPLRAELQAHGILANPTSIIAHVGDALPLAGVTDPALTTVAIVEKVDAATNKVAHEQFAPALVLFDAVRDLVHDNPVLVVTDGASPGWLTKAYAQMALAHDRLGQRDQAAEALTEQIRSHPERPITSGDFGPEVEKLYTATRKSYERLPHGSFLVSVDRPDAQIFIGYVGRGRGGSFTGDFGPGTYPVLVQEGGIARRYAKKIDPAHDPQTELRITWDLDSRFTATPDWIGAVWPRGNDRTLDLARALAVRLPDHGLKFVTIVVRDGKRYVIAKTDVGIRMNGAGACAIELGERDAEKLHALALCLESGERTADLVGVPTATPAPPPVAPAPAGARPESHDESVLQPVLIGGLGAGVGAVGSGIYAAVITDGSVHEHRGLGVVLISSGVVVSAACLYLIHRTSGAGSATSAPTVSLTPQGATVGWATTF